MADLQNMAQNKIAEIRRHGMLQGRNVSMSDPGDKRRILAAAYSKARRSIGGNPMRHEPAVGDGSGRIGGKGGY